MYIKLLLLIFLNSPAYSMNILKEDVMKIEDLFHEVDKTDEWYKTEPWDTQLKLWCQDGNMSIIKFLIENHDLPVDVTPGSRSLIHWTLQPGIGIKQNELTVDFLKYILLEKNIDINKHNQSASGFSAGTPLQISFFNAVPLFMFEALLKYGFFTLDKNILNSNGKTPIEELQLELDNCIQRKRAIGGTAIGQVSLLRKKLNILKNMETYKDIQKKCCESMKNNLKNCKSYYNIIFEN